jgi:hypothetical protein
VESVEEMASLASDAMASNSLEEATTLVESAEAQT